MTPIGLEGRRGPVGSGGASVGWVHGCGSESARHSRFMQGKLRQQAEIGPDFDEGVASRPAQGYQARTALSAMGHDG